MGKTYKNSGISKRPFVEVLFIGTSRTRQVFEALVCGFQDQITEHIFQFKGPTFTLNHTLMESELFTPLVNTSHFRNGSCYNPSIGAKEKHSRWYRDGISIPKNVNFCSDNVARAEFTISGRGKAFDIKVKIRFYFLNYPWAWTNFTTPFEALGIQRKREIDFMFYEGDPSYWRVADFELFSADYLNVRNKIRIPHHFYESVQLSSIGRYFGADNPGLYEVPDKDHQCMPGPPDDKINSILWYILALAKIEKKKKKKKKKKNTGIF